MESWPISAAAAVAELAVAVVSSCVVGFVTWNE